MYAENLRKLYVIYYNEGHLENRVSYFFTVYSLLSHRHCQLLRPVDPAVNYDRSALEAEVPA